MRRSTSEPRSKRSTARPGLAPTLGDERHQVPDRVRDVAQLLEVALQHAPVLTHLRRRHQRHLRLADQVLQRRAELVREPRGHQARAFLFGTDAREHALERAHEFLDLLRHGSGLDLDRFRRVAHGARAAREIGHVTAGAAHEMAAREPRAGAGDQREHDRNEQEALPLAVLRAAR
jgi:hypothetical protein